MKIPKKVKIGGTVYKVKILDDWPSRNGDDGECDDYTNTLYIHKKLSKDAQEVTFFHEAMHAMNSTIDHTALDSLAEQLYQFFKDNKLIK